MCTSIVVNKNKTLVGWNLDLLDYDHRVRAANDGVYIEINDSAEGWLPLFGANSSGGFVGMPTCWPFDERSDPKGYGLDIIHLNIDYLLQKIDLADVKNLLGSQPVYSQPGVTFMSALSDKDGNVLHIVPGQGYLSYNKPEYKVLTNFSPFKQNAETHPWLGWDRYQTADSMLKQAGADFDVGDCFDILKACSQTLCPTVVSMVFDVTFNTVYWCENREWDSVKTQIFNDEQLILKERPFYV